MDSQSKKKKKIEKEESNTDQTQEKLQIPQSPLICAGCRDGIMNQLGHMDIGGCLYDPDY